MPHQVYHDVDGSIAMSLMFPETFVIQKPTVILLALMVRFNIFSDKLYFETVNLHNIYRKFISKCVQICGRRSDTIAI